MLASEREKHAAVATELNMKNLSLADKLKETNADLTGNCLIQLYIKLRSPSGL